MDPELPEKYDNNVVHFDIINTESGADISDTKLTPDCQTNGFVNKSFSDGDANDVGIPSIHVNDAIEKHVNDVFTTQFDDVTVTVDDCKTQEDMEMHMGAPVTEQNGKSHSLHNSMTDVSVAGQIRGSGSYSSLNDLDLPKYYIPRSRKGLQMGSENLITDNVSIVKLMLSPRALLKRLRKTNEYGYLSVNGSLCVKRHLITKYLRVQVTGYTFKHTRHVKRI